MFLCTLIVNFLCIQVCVREIRSPSKIYTWLSFNIEFILFPHSFFAVLKYSSKLERAKKMTTCCARASVNNTSYDTYIKCEFYVYCKVFSRHLEQ